MSECVIRAPTRHARTKCSAFGSHGWQLSGSLAACVYKAAFAPDVIAFLLYLTVSFGAACLVGVACLRLPTALPGTVAHRTQGPPDTSHLSTSLLSLLAALLLAAAEALGSVTHCRSRTGCT